VQPAASCRQSSGHRAARRQLLIVFKQKNEQHLDCGVTAAPAPCKRAVKRFTTGVMIFLMTAVLGPEDAKFSVLVRLL
jgi:hypothetical protein